MAFDHKRADFLASEFWIFFSLFSLINSYFDVLLDNAFTVKQKTKDKSDSGITGWCAQWDISRCTATKGMVVLKITVSLNELFLLF